MLITQTQHSEHSKSGTEPACCSMPLEYRHSTITAHSTGILKARLGHIALPDPADIVCTSAAGNIFDALPSSLTRSTSIVLMIAHQCFAYAMFIMPVHHMWEKAIGTHDKPYWIRLPSRIPVGKSNPKHVYVYIALNLYQHSHHAGPRHVGKGHHHTHDKPYWMQFPSRIPVGATPSI